MNKIYKSLWNVSLGAWVATSEISQARGKRSSSTVAGEKGNGGRALKMAALFAMFTLG